MVLMWFSGFRLFMRFSGFSGFHGFQLVLKWFQRVLTGVKVDFNEF